MQAEFSAAITPVFSVTWPSRNHADLVCVCVCVCVEVYRSAQKCIPNAYI